MSKPLIRVAIVSDVVCPWCYIGKKRFEKAVKAYSDKADFEIAYYPFELNPEMPETGVDQKDHLTNKFGSEAQYERLTDHVTQVAAAEGLVFDFNKQRITPNTRDCHRLILLSREENKQALLVEALFKAYFTDGIDLSRRDNLLSIAQRIGMDREKTAAFLESEAGIAEVAVAEDELQRMGIRGVPFYIINDKYGISGAQSPQAFMEAFESVGNRLADSGEVCDVDKNNC